MVEPDRMKQERHVHINDRNLFKLFGSLAEFIVVRQPEKKKKKEKKEKKRKRKRKKKTWYGSQLIAEKNVTQYYYMSNSSACVYYISSEVTKQSYRINFLHIPHLYWLMLGGAHARAA